MSAKNKGKEIAEMENFMAIYDALGVCKFSRGFFLLEGFRDRLAQVRFKTVTGVVTDLYTYLVTLPKAREAAGRISSYASRGEFSKALQVAEANRGILAMFIDVEDLLRKLRAAAELKEAVDRANAALRRGDVERAARIIEDVSPEARRLFPEEYRRVREYIHGLEMLVEAIRRDPIAVIECLTSKPVRYGAGPRHAARIAM